MKKYLYSLALLLVISINAYADGLTATLQQGDQMTPFYGDNAFLNAYKAADSGAVIILSPGDFYVPDTIKKEISIIGAGAFGDNTISVTSFIRLLVKADNVKLEGIYFRGTGTNCLTLLGTKNCYIKRCRILGNIKATIPHYNTIIDNCVINEDQASGCGMKYCIKNSIIGHFLLNTAYTDRQIYVTNCVILDFAYYGSGSWSYTQPIGIYKNNVLGYNCTTNSASVRTLVPPSEFYSNLILSTHTTNYDKLQFHSNCIKSGNNTGLLKTYYTGSYETYSKNIAGLYSLRWMSKETKGQDGTNIGVTGGSGFSIYPSIPRVVSKTISSSTDKDGKINVKLTVEVEQ